MCTLNVTKIKVLPILLCVLNHVIYTSFCLYMGGWVNGCGCGCEDGVGGLVGGWGMGKCVRKMSQKSRYFQSSYVYSIM